MSKIPILPWESILRKLTRHGEHLLESCHQTDEVWAYDSPRCSRPPEKKMWEKACSVSIRLERTRMNYPVQSCAASGTQTSSLKASVALSALLCPWLSLWVLLKWTRKFVSRFSIQISLPRGEKIELLRSGKLHLFWYFIFYFIEAQGGGYSASRGWRQWVPVPGQHQPCSPGGVLCHQREASRVLLPFGLRKKGLITPIFCQLGRHWANRELWGEAGDNLLGVGGEKGCQALLLVFLFLF